MTGRVSYEQRGRTARIHMDDGGRNIMGVALLSELHAAFDRAAADKAIVVLTGRADTFSAGFDLKVIGGGAPTEFYSMLRFGAELALKILSFPTPVVTAVAGHAFPMGAFLVLASDYRIGTRGDWRIGLNEVQVGIPVPRFAQELARQRLAPAYFSRTAITGEMFGPDEALTAGFIDEVVPAADLAAAIERAVARMETVHLAPHVQTKLQARAATIAAMRGFIDSDITLQFAEAVMAQRRLA